MHDLSAWVSICPGQAVQIVGTGGEVLPFSSSNPGPALVVVVVLVISPLFHIEKALRRNFDVACGPPI